MQYNQSSQFAPFVRRTLVPCARCCWRYKNSALNMMNKLVVVLLLLLFSGVSLAEIVKGPSPSEPGDIAVEIVASGSPEYVERWNSTPSVEAQTITRLKQSAPEQLIVISFLVSGMTGNSERKYSFSVSMYVEDPNGKLVLGQRDFARGQGEYFVNPAFIMANPALDLILEESDPLGTYKVFAQVTDLVSGERATSIYEIDFVKEGL